MSSKQDIKAIWAVILPYPIGTRVRYIKKLCTCRSCGITNYVGQEGTITRYLTLDERLNVKNNGTYPNLDLKETVYAVMLDNKGQFSFRHFELEVL